MSLPLAAAEESTDILKVTLPQVTQTEPPEEAHGEEETAESEVPPPESEDPPQIGQLTDAKQVIAQIIAELRSVVKDNDATPDIQTCLGPLVKSVEQAFPRFLASSINYYRQYERIRRTAKSPQVISSASVSLPLGTFMKGWTGLSKVVDTYADTRPSPHAEEITTKFKAIKASLEVITQTNSARKYPSMGLGKRVASIQLLCDTIAKSITELFKEPQFPNFTMDALKVYKQDVKGFMRVIKDAFYNEFTQSGVPGHDLGRIKLNVISSITDIIDALKAAFSFPVGLRRARDLKNQFNALTGEIVNVLSKSFNIVRPDGCLLEYAEVTEPETPEERTLRQIAEDDVEARLRAMDPIRRVEIFLHEVMPLFGLNLMDVDDAWTGLRLLQREMKSLVNHFASNESHVDSMKLDVVRLKQLIRDNEMVKGSRNGFEIGASDTFRVEIARLKEERVRDAKKYDSLQNVVYQQQESMEQMNAGQMALSKNVVSLCHEWTGRTLDAAEALNCIREFHESTVQGFVGEKSDICERLGQLVVNDGSLSVHELIDRVSAKLKEARIKRTSTLPTKKGITAQHSYVGAELMPIQSPEPSQVSASISSSNIIRRARPVDYDAMLRKAAETNEVNIKTLRSIACKLDGYVAGNCASEHMFALRDTSDASAEMQASLSSLISDQLQALKELVKSLLANDTETKEALAVAETSLRQWTSRVSNVLGESDDLLGAAIGVLTNTQNPLHDKLIELTRELVKRDSETKVIWSRVAAIAGKSIQEQLEYRKQFEFEAQTEYYNVKDMGSVKVLLRVLGEIQDDGYDKNMDIEELNQKMEETEEALYDIEARLTDFAGNGGTISERIHRALDVILEPCFHDRYLKIEDFETLIGVIRPEDSHDPREYVPMIRDKYIAMNAAADGAKEFVILLDTVFAGLSRDSLSKTQLAGVQANVNALHGAMTRLGGVSASPVLAVISRFVALVQTLVSKMSASFGTNVVF